MKTALQELIELLEAKEQDIFSSEYFVVHAIKMKAESLLEKEKEQIIDAFYQGRNLYNNFNDDSEEYYNETYK